MSSTKIKNMYLFDIPKRSAISSYVFFSMSMLITQTLETNLFFFEQIYQNADPNVYSTHKYNILK